MRSLRLPRKLAYTAVRCALAGTLACSGHTNDSPQPPADASQDTSPAPDDASADATADTTNPPDATLDAIADGPAEAMRDAVSDAPCDAPETYCGPIDPMDAAMCPGFICGTQCPPGCEPYA